MEIGVQTIDEAYEDLQKARTPGAKDIKPYDDLEKAGKLGMHWRRTKVGDTVQFKHQIGHMTFGTKTGKVVNMEGDRAHIESGGKTYKKTNWKNISEGEAKFPTRKVGKKAEFVNTYGRKF